MDTVQIYKILSGLFKNKKIQFDVLACDQLKSFKIKSYPLALVCNDEPSNESGHHWVALFIEGYGKPIEFFCSYGMGIQSYNHYFKDFAKRLKKDVIQNKVQLQSYHSNVCGKYAIYFLWKRVCKNTLMSVYCPFSKDVQKNDKIINAFMIQKNYLLNCNKFIIKNFVQNSIDFQ